MKAPARPSGTGVLLQHVFFGELCHAGTGVPLWPVEPARLPSIGVAPKVVKNGSFSALNRPILTTSSLNGGPDSPGSITATVVARRSLWSPSTAAAETPAECVSTLSDIGLPSIVLLPTVQSAKHAGNLSGPRRVGRRSRPLTRTHAGSVGWAP